MWPRRSRVQVASLTPTDILSLLERVCYIASVGSAAWRAANADKVRGYWRAYYYRNREEVAEGRRRRKADLRAWLRMYKASLVCATCGENHPAALDFHHSDPSEKELSIGEATGYGWARAKLLDEIAKCEVLCANCHRKRHWSPFDLRTVTSP